jgi:hypothetical protein
MNGRPAPSLALLSAITALAFCGLHMVVPALPLLVAAFADTPAHVQLAVSLYLAGIGAGQLVYGPVSDRFGRRPVRVSEVRVQPVAGRSRDPVSRRQARAERWAGQPRSAGNWRGCISVLRGKRSIDGRYSGLCA